MTTPARHGLGRPGGPPEPSAHSGRRPTAQARAVSPPRPALTAVENPPGTDELPEDRFLDRELSWLAFNERVLELTESADVPLLERARFLAIFASNLDEFFMVRVAGLKRRIAAGLAVPSASGLAPRAILEELLVRARQLMARHSEVYRSEVRPALEAERIQLVSWGDLSHAEQRRLRTVFEERVFPILTPLAVDPAHPFPYISGLSLNLAVVVRNLDTETEHFARVKVPPVLPRFLEVDEPAGAEPGQPDRVRFIGLEEVIAEHLDQLFPGMEVLQHHTFRVTRNEDLEVEEDDAENLLQALEKELLRRRFGPPVRLEVAEDIDEHVLDLLVRELRVRPEEVFRLPRPLDLRGLMVVADTPRPELAYRRFVPRTHIDLTEGRETSSAANVFAAIRRGDVLLHHPYDSFSTSVQAFLEQAAADPRVLAIKQTLYRTSGDSPIVDALIDAADAGKQVLALVEIKARFDEQANISWARKLEESGVHVVYGIVGLKTHAKLSLVVRQEQGRMRRYCHVGTGNYHPKTARLYEDVGVLTCDPDVGEDLSRLFNQLSGYAPRTAFRRLLVAPRSLRDGLIDRINREVRFHEQGLPARVRIKVNSIVDEEIIDALYRASMAGVPVDLVVRGICAVRPGVPGLSETIRVRSVLGRFLEHSRIFTFEGGGNPVVYLGSGDLMHRNLDRRVESLLEVADAAHQKYLNTIIDLAMDEGTGAWQLGPDGTWIGRHRAPDGTPLLDLQDHLISQRNLRGGGGRR